MIILCILAMLTIIGFLIFKLGGYAYADVGGLLFSVGGGFLFIALIVLGINHLTMDIDIAKIESVRTTINQSRELNNQETTALTLAKIETNKTIAANKAIKNTLFSIWVPKKLAEIKLIE